MRHLLIAGLITAVGCHPFHGALQTEIPDTPIPMVNSATGMAIQDALILPRYQSDESFAESRFWVANAFVYQLGEPFPLRRPKSDGVAWAFGRFTGKAVTLEGTLVVSPGYRPCYTQAMWDRSLEREFTLDAISMQESIASLSYILQVLSQESVTGDYATMWGVSTKFELEILLTPDERELSLRYLEKALEGLGASPNELPNIGMQPPADTTAWWSDGYGKCVSRG